MASSTPRSAMLQLLCVALFVLLVPLGVDVEPPSGAAHALLTYPHHASFLAQPHSSDASHVADTEDDDPDGLLAPPIHGGGSVPYCPLSKSPHAVRCRFEVLSVAPKHGPPLA